MADVAKEPDRSQHCSLRDTVKRVEKSINAFAFKKRSVFSILDSSPISLVMLYKGGSIGGGAPLENFNF